MRKIVPWVLLVAAFVVLGVWAILLPGDPADTPPPSNSALAIWEFGSLHEVGNENFFVYGVVVVLFFLPYLVAAAHLREIAVGGAPRSSLRYSLPLGLALAPLALYVDALFEPMHDYVRWGVFFVLVCSQLAVFTFGYIRAINAPRRVASTERRDSATR